MPLLYSPVMAVPSTCTVLVIGGGPAGSYSAAALALEGIDVVVLEAEKFPRYHIGESMLPSVRHFLKFIDGFEKWNAHGFQIKNGGAFKLDHSHPDTYTDFLASGGPDGYAWNVIRSEADELLFKHAGSCGAKIFDATKVNSIEFSPTTGEASQLDKSGLGRPVSAKWTQKDGTTGTIAFQYLIDASGRQGILSIKYMKNRAFNQGLKNVASWGYWRGGGVYGSGTYKEGSPFFEALTDGSGWCWFIPLHNGTHSVGIVQNQEIATSKKRAANSPSTKEFYIESLELLPGIKGLLENAELISEIKSGSDWSYSASSYALPYARIAGDAGSFIDPFFSSGVHLALNGGLSAAVTIAASIRGDCTEEAAASWHSKRITESYTRFLLVILSATKQIKHQNAPIIHDFDEETFERAFELYLPVIQGTVDADVKGKLTQEDVSKVVEFSFNAYADIPPEQRDSLVQKLKSLGIDDQGNTEKISRTIEEMKENITPEETRILDVLRSQRMLRHEDTIDIRNFKLDCIDGMAPNLERGKLGLVKAVPAKVDPTKLFSVDYLRADRPNIRTQRAHPNSKSGVQAGEDTKTDH